MIIYKNNDIGFMQKALDLAALARGRTNPNPMVGALVVKNGLIVGEGYHRQAGTPHAEVFALGQAGEQARDATLYVTLEPCSHYGRTAPCADAIIRAGIAKVVVATEDPNPLVSGKGLGRLREAGIEVEAGVLKAEACRLNEVFFKYIQTRTPFVALKTAMTLDGKIASYSGDSKWITGETARRYVHELRNTYDAIMAGIGTVLKDDPLLNTRLEGADSKDPVRVVIDGRLRIPLDSKIARTAAQQRTMLFCSADADAGIRRQLENLGLEIIGLDCDPDAIPLEVVLKILGGKTLCSLLVEGGGEINGYLFNQNLIDKLYWFIAPKIIGGRQGATPIGGKGIEFMNDARELKSIQIHQLGADLLITGYLREW